MIKYFKKKIKKIINFFLNYIQKINIIGTKNTSILYHRNHIVDLNRDWKLQKKKYKINFILWR